jgi:hypothetical protein
MIATKISGRFSRLLLRSAVLQQMFEQEMSRKRRSNLRLMRLNALRLKVQECIYQLAVRPAPALVRCKSATR